MAGSACLAGPVEDLRLLISRGDLPGCAGAADKALQAKPRDATLRFLRAVVLMDLRRDDEALALFTELDPRVPGTAGPVQQPGLAAGPCRPAGRGAVVAAAALLNDPNHRAARVNLGQIHLVAGRAGLGTGGQRTASGRNAAAQAARLAHAAGQRCPARAPRRAPPARLEAGRHGLRPTFNLETLTLTLNNAPCAGPGGRACFGTGGAWAQKVKLATSLGDIVVELDAEKAPKTVDNFLQYVKAGHYDGTVFHRVIDGFMIQGGGYKQDLQQKPTRAADPAGKPQRPDQRARHHRDGPHRHPGLGHLAVLHQRQRQPAAGPGQLARRPRLRRVRQGGCRHGRGRQDQGRAHASRGHAPERAGDAGLIRKATVEN
jgi:hypothetical protein